MLLLTEIVRFVR